MRRRPVAWLALAGALCGAAGASAQATDSAPFTAVRAELPPSPGVRDVKFRDFFRLPVGPRGLEPAPGLLALAGQRVRLVGYMAEQGGDTGAPGLFILAPLPVQLGDEDEALADDLPPNAVHVHLPPSQAQRRLAHAPGLLAVTGTLDIGARAEADGRRSFVRLLQGDADLSTSPEGTTR